MKDAIILTSIIALAILLRVPLLYNASVHFNADEANAALLVKHLLEKGEFTTHAWSVSYAGILEQITAIPFVKTLGFTPLAFKLSPILYYCFWIITTYLLAKSLAGRLVAAISSLVLAASSPMLVLWSQLVNGDLKLMYFLGTMSLYLLHKHSTADRRKTPLLLTLALVLGLGLYANGLFALYLIPISLFSLLRSDWWARVRGTELDRSVDPQSPHGSSMEGLGKAQGQNGMWRNGILFALGFALGFCPKIYQIIWESPSTVHPFYLPAMPSRIWSNVRLLVRESLPSLLGVNPFFNPGVDYWTANLGGSPWLYYWSLTVLALLASACVSKLWSHKQELFQVVCLKPVELSTSALLLSLLLIVPTAFILSTQPQDLLSNRYLVPLYSAIPLILGMWLYDLRKKFGRLAPLAGIMLFVGFYISENVRSDILRGYLSPEWRLQRLPNPLMDVISYLEAHKVQGAYGSYWLTYNTTFFSNERIIVAPFPYVEGWDRYPPYSRYVKTLRDPAYIFFDYEELKEDLDRLLKRRGIPYIRKAIGPFVVYHGTGATPFYNYLAHPPPAPLPQS